MVNAASSVCYTRGSTVIPRLSLSCDRGWIPGGNESINQPQAHPAADPAFSVQQYGMEELC